ncbi:MAG TPA: (4Fe-4S)-binding protein [Gemmatimonadales bacterium]|nr:(4Fe-4S)-binding protein [Gemmatimonadales bacterium]
MPKRLQVYQAEDVTVTFDPNICIHAEECVRVLPQVFDPAQLRWIRPERAPADAVRAAVARCPSGALRATPAAGASPSAPGVTVTVSADGPLRLRGPFRIVNDAGELLAEGDAATLCRCGATGNPPFCDGTHERIGVRRA